MSKLVELNFNPDRKTLRQFGFIALGGFGLLALAAWYEALMFSGGLGEARVTVAGALLGLGVVSAFFGLVAPGLNRGLYVGLSVLTFPIGLVMSYVIMATLFFLIIAPISVLMRIVGFDPLNRAYDPKANSYFVKARPARSKESYFRQY